jgi:oxygen-independent coproporphyrinogen-3 oxidase
MEHVSAYSLIVEEGTALARRIKSGEIPMPDADVQAEMYRLADSRFTTMGLHWYELSNWSSGLDTQSRHNIAYWQNADWWGFGAGAHSYVGGRRWWNAKHPAAYAQRLEAGESPELGSEIPTETERYIEDVLLGTRLAVGYPITRLSGEARREVPALIAEGLIDGSAALSGRVVLTLDGRLLADNVVRRLT